MTDTKDNKILGTLCARGHDHNDTGKSLRYKCGHHACVECITINARRNREAKPEQYNEMKRQYRAKTKGKTREYQKGYYAQNIEKRKIQSAATYLQNKGRVLEKQRLYRLNQDKDLRRQYAREYTRKQRINNTQLAIGVRLRGLVAQALRRYSQSGKIMASSKYGIDYKAIIEHLGPPR